MLIRALIKKKPHLRQYLTKCNHCGILFFTDPRNAGRQDIRCPFGCREAHRKESSKQRSIEYYQSEEGKKKKKELNKRRRKSEGNKPEKDAQEVEVVVVDEDQMDMDKYLLIYLQLMVWHIEGRRIALEVILMKVKTLLRQHSMDILKNRVYHCSKINKSPP